jgi:hypothetical protein
MKKCFLSQNVSFFILNLRKGIDTLKLAVTYFASTAVFKMLSLSNHMHPLLWMQRGLFSWQQGNSSSRKVLLFHLIDAYMRFA